MEQEQKQPQEQTITFGYMVGRLFKKTNMFHHQDALMHAAVGIGSEVNELIDAVMFTVETGDGLENLKEELGDAEFYMEALVQSASLSEDRLEELFAIRTLGLTAFKENTTAILLGISKHASSLLDTAKRGWVYGSDLTEDKFRNKLYNDVAYLAAFLDLIYSGLNISRDDVIHENMNKLIGPNGRYRDQVYSDDAARARADKQGEDA